MASLRTQRNSKAVPDFKRREPRWWRHANVLPDGSVSSHSFRVAWYDESGKRVRRNVATREEAESLVREHQKKLVEKHHGLTTQVTAMSQAQIKHTELAFNLLEKHKFYDPREPESAQSIWQAAEWFVEHYNPLTDDIPTVNAAIPAFLATRSGKSIRTTRSHEGYLNEFAVSHGNQLVAAITSAMIASYLDKVKAGPVAKLHRWDTLHAFFAFCAGKKNSSGQWIGTNPVKQVPEPEYHPAKVEIYSIPECRLLIQNALNLGYAPNIIVRLFTMIREEEMMKMVKNRGSIWAYANLKTQQITLNAAEVKTRADKKRKGRKITILPILERWLVAFMERGWDITHNRSVYEKVRLGVDESKIGRGSGYHNLVRHTSISYRVATENSIFDVAGQAGSSEPVIRDSYLKRVPVDEAREFFTLAPEEFRWPGSQPVPPVRGAKIIKTKMNATPPEHSR